MAIVAGIDEAGFGPILGPLVVSATVLEVPGPLVGQDLWRALAPAVSRKSRKRKPTLAIADSKALYTPACGLLHLERGVLGCLAQQVGAPQVASLRGLLEWLAPSILAEMDLYPWYHGEDVALPTCCDPVDLRLRTNGLRAAMQSGQIAMAGARSRVLPVGRYNRLVAATDNKATTLLDQTCALIDWVWRTFGAGRGALVCVDRQGGREHYLRALQRLFEGSAFKVLAETPEHSGYRITIEGAALEIHFHEKCEDRHLPVALASMISKYLRELFMVLENRYWAARVPGLRLTAGYYTDGRRFLGDIEAACQQLGTPRELLIRSR